MPEPLSIAAGVCLGYAALAASYARNRSAVSPEVDLLRQTAVNVVASAEESQALFGSKRTAISGLLGLAEECCQLDWDGSGSEPLDSTAIATARDFIRAMPEGLPLPEFAPEPDGSVSFDWTVSKHRRLTVSVGRSDRLAYAWLDGADKGHGVARFDGSVIPTRVLEAIRSTIGHVPASVRAA